MSINTIPIAFCFDDNWLLPAQICLSSLLEHAHSTTFYDIFILHKEEAEFPGSGELERLFRKYKNFKLTYRNVGTAFQDAYEVRGITIAAYYRLLIPELIPEYDKIMYHDVDVIFRSDLADVFLKTDLTNYYFAGVVSIGVLNKKISDKRIQMGLTPKNYINSGNLIFNSKLLREEKVVPQFIKEAKNDYLYQDQDIISIVCKGKIKALPPAFGGAVGFYRLASLRIKQDFYSPKELEECLQNGIVHYNGAKPWKEWCINYDIWWEYYRKSIFFDPEFYFTFYQSRLQDNVLDPLSFWKRIKLVLRYFKTGQKRLLN